MNYIIIISILICSNLLAANIKQSKELTEVEKYRETVLKNISIGESNLDQAIQCVKVSHNIEGIKVCCQEHYERVLKQRKAKKNAKEKK